MLRAILIGAVFAINPFLGILFLIATAIQAASEEE